MTGRAHSPPTEGLTSHQFLQTMKSAIRAWEITVKSMFSNATVAWNDQEIARRESLIREIPILILSAWQDLNPAIRMERCETPILVPAQYLASHVSAGFKLIPAGDRGFLRPETTAGTFEAMAQKWPDQPQLRKRLPFCMWQAGLSFRDEKNAETMRASKLRLIQFYQLEFQLFTGPGTKALYLEHALSALVARYGGIIKSAEELPHYSMKTLDWMMGDLEVAGCSERIDWEHGPVFEVAIGLDRLMAIQINGAQDS